MKTLTTLTAVAALVAGLSFAQAQSPSATQPAPNSINSGAQTGTGDSKSGAQMNGSAMQKNGGMKASGKVAVTGTSKFCIKDTGSAGSWNCKFASIAACQQEAKTGLKKECGPNPNLSATTGMKAK